MGHPEDRAHPGEWGHAGQWASPPLDLAVETAAYQVLLEGHRAEPDDEEIYLDMLKAKAAMEVAWLQANPGMTL